LYLRSWRKCLQSHLHGRKDPTNRLISKQPLLLLLFPSPAQAHMLPVPLLLLLLLTSLFS
jgi:hypothetical protein